MTLSDRDDFSIEEFAKNSHGIEAPHPRNIEDFLDSREPVDHREQKARAMIQREPAELVARHQQAWRLIEVMKPATVHVEEHITTFLCKAGCLLLAGCPIEDLFSHRQGS